MIRLQFVLGAGWSSRLIAWYGQGYGGWSHVDAILPDGSLLGARSDLVGGQPEGVRIRPPFYERWKRRAILTLDSTAAEAVTWERFLRDQIGKGYDQADILGLIIGKPLMSDGHWICSALQSGALQAIQKLPTLHVTPQQIAPNTLATVCEAIGGKLQEIPS